MYKKIQVKNIPSDKTVEEWKINGKTVSSAPETFNHTIVKEDADSNGKTRITYTLKNKAALLRVDFDKEKVTVEEALTTEEWKQLNSGSEIAENTQLRFTAIGLSADSTVESWIVGKTNIPAEGHELTYIVRKADADNKTVTISYTERKRVNIKIHFNAVQVKVEAEQAGTWNALTSGSTVQEHTRLTAIGLPADTPVQAWKVGNTIVLAKGSELIHTVRRVDADSSNRVALAYTVKSDKLIIAFDKTKVRVIDDNKYRNVRDGDELTVGMKLYIVTQNLPAGEIVDTWKIGKRNIPADSNDCKYTVTSEDAENGIITISYTTKTAKKFTLKFEEAKMTVKVRRQYGGSWKTLSNGAQVEEGTEIDIAATDLPAGHIVDTWKIGTRTITTDNKDKYEETVKSADAENGIITISYTTKIAKKFTLKFEEATMTVSISQQYGQGKTLSTDAQVEEGTEIRIEADNLPAGHIVDTWTIGKRTEEHDNDNGNSTWFWVGSDYAKGNTIDISYTTKTAKKFTLKFAEAKMTVSISQDSGQGQTLANNAQVEEETQISIVAKDLPTGHIVDTWTIGKRTGEANNNNGNSTWFWVGSDYAKGNTIDISYTTKTAKKFTLKFAEAKMTVSIWQNGQDQTLANNAQVEEGTQIRIVAKDLPVGEIVDEWKIGKRTAPPHERNRCRFTVGSNYAKGDTIDISYTTKNG